MSGATCRRIGLAGLALAAAAGVGAGSCDRAGVEAAFEWVAHSRAQCEPAPWDGHPSPEPSSYPLPELAALDTYLEEQGIDLEELGFVWLPGLAAPAVCGAARTDLVVARASPAAAQRLVREFGFRYLAGLSEGPWLSGQPIQCGGNPWIEDAAPFTEAWNVADWAASQGALLQWVGFAYRERWGVCLACSCPRGDRLLARAGSERDAEVLGRFSLERLFY
jgi:hypothetical protein